MLSKTPLQKTIVFFIGTTAEYIKLFTIIEKCKQLNVPYKIISSGQNEIIETDIAKETNLHIDLQLSYEKDIIKNVFGLFSWFFITKNKAPKKIKDTFTDVDFSNSIMVVHGDTLSTVMGAQAAKKLGMKVAHVEAGLRSRHWFSPFPEEFDRCIVSFISDFNFCPGSEPIKNLRKAKGKNINTKYNTIIDALNFSEQFECKNHDVKNIIGADYCVFVIHRQENLLQSRLVNNVVDKVVEVSKQRKVVFILHQITYNTLLKLNLLKKLEEQENIILLHRIEYFDFMKLLINSQFVITDGGSNQEELYYMGKPTVIMRSSTERLEGIGENALMYGGNFENVNKFIDNFETYKKEKIVPNEPPTDIIVQSLINEIKNLAQVK
jgi:UDP-N-acetylglucosamine 2-epimerase (non-hydrolysing)